MNHLDYTIQLNLTYMIKDFSFNKYRTLTEHWLGFGMAPLNSQNLVSYCIFSISSQISRFFSFSSIRHNLQHNNAFDVQSCWYYLCRKIHSVTFTWRFRVHQRRLNIGDYSGVSTNNSFSSGGYRRTRYLSNLNNFVVFHWILAISIFLYRRALFL